VSLEEAFIQDVRDNPDDDTPRLIYADWLADGGDADRAEFIRVQCDLERLPAASERAAALRRRAVELQAEHESAWLGEWSERLVRWTFRRGFLDAVVLTARPFLDNGGELFRRHPVRQVAFVQEDGTPVDHAAVPELAACPHLAHVRSLDATACRPDEPYFGMYDGGHPGAAWCSALAGARHVTRLEELLLDSGLRNGPDATTVEAFAALASAAHLRTLRRLSLAHAYPCGLGDSLVDALARSTFAHNLETLILDSTAITDAGARRLADTPAFARLRRLGLADCAELGASGLRATLESPHLAALEEVGLDAASELVGVLADSPRLGQLRGLTVARWSRSRRNSLDAAEWLRLARRPDLTLKRFRLSYDAITDVGLAALLAAPGLAGLEELSVAWVARTGGEASAALRRSAIGPRLAILHWQDGRTDAEPLVSWPGLRGLSAWGFGFGECSGKFAPVLASPHFPRGLTRLSPGIVLLEDDLLAMANCLDLAGLTSLAPSDCEWTLEAMEAVLHSPYLRNLEALHLGSESYRTDSLLLLASSSGLPRLRDLVIGSGTQEVAQDALRQRFGPRMRVWVDC
jgi:uncharacterized protein (TIGR02996 family)